MRRNRRAGRTAVALRYKINRAADYWPRQWAEAFVAFATGEARPWLHQLGMRWFPIVGRADRGGYGALNPGCLNPGCQTGGVAVFLAGLCVRGDVKSPALGCGDAHAQPRPRNGGMDTHRNTNDSGWTDRSSIPSSFYGSRHRSMFGLGESTSRLESSSSVRTGRRLLRLLRRRYLRSGGGPVPGLRCVSCHVGVGRSDAAMRVLSRLSCHVGKTDGKSPIESSRTVTLSCSMSASFAIACRRSGSNGVP
jgi:hypothetical protein